MHDPSSQGSDFFRCDFCRKAWSEDNPMVEGHQGSLICHACLSLAFREVSLMNDPPLDEVAHCTMCLEQRNQPGWQSPAYEEAVICLRCIKQAATTLEKDSDVHWSRPEGTVD